jgi:hypothetical protein
MNLENFDAVPAGALPAGWVAGVTGRGAPRGSASAQIRLLFATSFE